MCCSHLTIGREIYLAPVPFREVIDHSKNIVKTSTTPSCRYTVAAQGIKRRLLDIVAIWSSMFKMLNSLLPCRELCLELIEESRNLSVMDLVKLLEPIHEATLKI
ncbi:unnamed protein product [Ceratitis capitata]|uniref:(Mediterranean fruit fly) hypothetical protein n=1 Tax=Ceratitis capitata TaxID=7213 RepID=A0A811UHX8_CERCA|nr:unnamed protein product [Ceratitis capitata]